MAVKLTDARLVLILGAAAQRNACCLNVPEALKGGAKRKFAAKLLAAGARARDQGEVGRTGLAA